MKLEYRVTSLLLLVLCLVGCTNRTEAVPMLTAPTESATLLFTPTLLVTPTRSISPATTPPFSPTPEENLKQLLSLSLPEFNARYSTRDMALTPDRQIMAVIAKERMHGEESIWLWDVNDFDHSLVAYQNIVDDLHSIAFNSEGNKLAIGGEGKIVILNWNIGDGLESIVFPNSGSDAVQISFGPNNTLLSSHYNGRLTIWDLVTKAAKYSVEITANPALFSSFAISPDGTTLIAGKNEETNLWDFETGKLKDVIHNQGDSYLTTFAYSSDGKLIATGGCNKFGFETCIGGQILIWNSSFESPSITISNYPSNVGVLEFSPKGNSLAVLNSGSVELLDLGAGQSTHAPSLGHVPGKLPPVDLFYTFGMKFLSDGRLVAVSTTEGIQLLDINRMSWVPNLRFILSLGYSYSITGEGDNLNFRTEPSMNSEIIKRLHTGEWFAVIDGPKISEDQVWWKVQIEDNTEGWIVEMPGWYEFIP